MGASYVQLPADSSGKKLATRQRTVGANTVEEQYVIPRSERVLSGVYMASVLAVVQAAATNGTSTGFFWLYNPVGSAVLLALRNVRYMCQHGTPATVSLTSPRCALSLFTFTGTPAGAAITSGKGDSSYATATAKLMSTQVTSVVTLGAMFASFLPVWSQSTSSGGPGGVAEAEWTPDEDGLPLLRAGEGIVCWQPDAGSTSDVRRQAIDFSWSEFTLP